MHETEKVEIYNFNFGIAWKKKKEEEEGEGDIVARDPIRLNISSRALGTRDYRGRDIDSA